MRKKSVLDNNVSVTRRVLRVLLRFLAVVLVLLLAIIVALGCAMWVLAKGPSPTAQRLFIMTVKETSAMGFLADVYLSGVEIDLIMHSADPEDEFKEPTDVGLITLPSYDQDAPVRTLETSGEGETPGVEEYADIELHDVTGNGYRGYMMIVRDPKRLFVSTPRAYGGYGLTLMRMVENTGAVAGINGGGFVDPTGSGTGGIPDGIVICDGVLMWGEDSGRGNVIGFDSDGILHVGSMTPREALALGIRHAASFGPTLISNGVPQRLSHSGINPRTAIGQRADGAVLMLVVDGRQVDSLGATLSDLTDIFLDFGAVNAANLDGGSSTLMMLDGEVINVSASISGPRYLPTAFLVSPLMENSD